MPGFEDINSARHPAYKTAYISEVVAVNATLDSSPDGKSYSSGELYDYYKLYDFVEIKPGRVINLSVEVDVHVDKTYNVSDVVSMIIGKVRDYFDINKRNMGDDIYIGDLKKEVSKLDGVANLIDIRVYNETGPGYSSTQTSQELYASGDCNRAQEEIVKGRDRIDLEASDGIIYSDGDCMLEVKWPEKDIRVYPKLV